MQTERADAGVPQSSSQTRSGVPVWIWAGVAALVVFSFYSAWDVRRLQEESHAVNERAEAQRNEHEKLEQQLAVAKREALILTDPASVKIELATHHLVVPKLEAKWHPQLGLVIIGQRVPVPSGDRVLQLWLIPKATDAKPIPMVILRPDGDGKIDALVAKPPAIMADVKALAISEEPAGGSPQPTGTPRWIGSVSGGGP